MRPLRLPTATSLLLAQAAADAPSPGREFVKTLQSRLREGGSDGAVILAGEETLATAARGKEALDKVAQAFGIAEPPPQARPNRAQRKLLAQQQFRQEQLAKAARARQTAQDRARDAADATARAMGLANEAERRSVKAQQREAERVAAEAAVVAAQQQAREATEAAQLEAAEAINAASLAQECLALVTQAIERAQHAAEIATGIARRCG